MNRHLSLLSYYFTPNGTLGEGPDAPSIYHHLFGNLIAGIDNYKEWEEFTDVYFGGCSDPHLIGTNSTPEDCVVSVSARKT